MKIVHCEVRERQSNPLWPMSDVWFTLWHVVLYGCSKDVSYCEWIVPGTIDIEVV